MFWRYYLLITLFFLQLFACSNLGMEEVKEYYENGSLKSVSRVHDGKLHGEQIRYHPNGKIQEIREWESGIPVGTVKMFDENEKMVKWGVYENSFLTLVNLDGDTIMQGHFMGVNPHGIFRSYYDNGKLKNIVEFKDGKKEGIEINFYPDGVLNAYAFYENDVKQGIVRVYFENGKMKMSAPMQNGKLSGNVKRYYNTGVLKSVGDFYGTNKEGIHVKYNDRGDTMSVQKYIEGEIVTGYNYDEAGS